MSVRSGRWDLLGHDADPVPADYFDVRDVSKTFRDKHDSLDHAWTTLDKLSRLDGWRGEAAESFAEHAHDGLSSLGKARDKYGMAAQALDDYADAVSTARIGSKHALDEAVEADAHRAANQHSLLTGVQEPTDDQKAAEQARIKRQDAAADALAAAVSELDTALDHLDEAARKCANGIRHASDHYKDGWFDDFKGWIRDHADLIKKIVEILEWIAIALAAIALVLAIVASGGLLLAIIEGVALAVSLALLAAHAGMMAAGVPGVGWGDIIMDLVAIASFGAGKALPVIAKAASARAAAAVTSEAVDSAARALPNTVKNALRIVNDANPLKQWALRQSDAAASGARAAVDAALHVSPSLAAKALGLGEENARLLAELKVIRGLSATAEVTELANKATTATVTNIARGAGDLGLALDDLTNKLADLGHHPITTPVEHLKSAISHVGDGAIEEVRHLHWRFAVAGR